MDTHRDDPRPSDDALPRGGRLTYHHDTEEDDVYALWYSNRQSIDPELHVVETGGTWSAVSTATGLVVGRGATAIEAIADALRNEAME